MKKKITPANIYPISSDRDDLHRWSFCYLHGMAEFDQSRANGDIFLSDIRKPEQGNHPVLIRGEAGVAIINADGSGRLVLLSDTLGLRHAISGEWE